MTGDGPKSGEKRAGARSNQTATAKQGSGHSAGFGFKGMAARPLPTQPSSSPSPSLSPSSEVEQYEAAAQGAIGSGGSFNSFGTGQRRQGRHQQQVIRLPDQSQGVIGSGGSFDSFGTGQRRQGRHQQQVIRLPDQPQGQVRRVCRRLPTPEPDTIERIYVQRTAGEVVEEITEIPMTPPVKVQSP